MLSCRLSSARIWNFTSLLVIWSSNLVSSPFKDNFRFISQVQVGDSSYVHLRIHQSLPQDGSKIELIAIRTGLLEDDSLDDFKADGKN